ncbi:MAG: VOC family protein [Thermoplasmatota archaeon]
MEIKELGHAVLYVRDLERSRKFYGELLGWRALGHGPGYAAFGTPRTHHELLLLEQPKATPLPPRPRIGLYHLGLKVGDSDDDLRAAKAELEAADVHIIGMSDHGVTHSLYLADPDGNELELYVDVDDSWKTDPSAVLGEIKPLRL